MCPFRLSRFYWNPLKRVIIRRYGRCVVPRSARLRSCRIFVAEGASLILGENVHIEKTQIYVASGSVVIDNDTILSETTVNVESGSLHVADHSMIRARRLWIRFGGKLEIGRYTNINSDSEVRCDEAISIGSYCQISYNVNIWDTNTHSILSREDRRRIAEQKFPYFGYEAQRPPTMSVTIGDDCWIGENATILKGSRLGDEVVVGYGTLIAGKDIPTKSTVTAEVNLRISSR